MIQKISATILSLLILTIANAQTEVVENYIKTYRTIAIQEMHRTGVPAAIKLAQGIHESMWGQSELVKKSNNHFGIKCKTGYTGPYVLHDDDARNEKFMKYESPEKSYIDHSDFLRTRSRYAFLFDLDPMDYEGWAHGLKKAGYATDPRYPQLIIKTIERYNLQDYTLIALGKMEMPEDMKQYLAVEAPKPEKKKIIYPQGDFKINDTRVVFVIKGTAYEDVAKKYNVPVQRILSYNDFKTSAGIATEDQLVYLQLKRTIGPKEFHEVQEGESIYDIAQTQGIRLESLLKYNNLTKFASPAIGSRLYLQDPSAKVAAGPIATGQAGLN